MAIKTKFLFIVSMILAAACVYFVADRVMFLRRAERTVGEVTTIQSSNDRCGSRKRRYDCTKFTADVQFSVRDAAYVVNVGAGTAYGHNRPLSSASYRVGSPVDVVYDQYDPRQAYRDTLWDVWSAPILTFIFQIASFVGGLRERRKSS